MYQWLNIAQYRVYDMYRVYIWCIKVYNTAWKVIFMLFVEA